MRKLLVATRNKHKAGEIKQILKDLNIVNFEIIDLNQTDIPIDFDVEETGETYAENAILKAEEFGKKSGLLTLSDDSGLNVVALGNRPGIYSARYCSGSDKDRRDKLLTELKNIPPEKRQAYYTATIAIYDPEVNKTDLFVGECYGKIIDDERGSGGFGYDSIFYLEESGKTMAELSDNEKNKISHRFRALEKTTNYLKKINKK